MIETRPGKGKPKVKGQTPQKPAQVFEQMILKLIDINHLQIV